MDSMSIPFYLRKILPEINVNNPVIRTIIQSDLSHEDKVRNILSLHMKSRKSTHTYHASQSLLNTNARIIHKLFPSHDMKDIYDKLHLFGDMPNRNEIVLRLISLSRATTNTPAKRPNIQYLDSVNNNQPLIKVRRMEDLAAGVSVPASTVQERNVVPLNDHVYFPTVPSGSGAIQERNNPPIHDHGYFPGDKPATVTSSDVIEEQNEPSSTIRNTYEIPDIMEHFDLPLINLFNLELPFADNNAGSEVAEAQLPYVNEETVECSTVGVSEETLVTNSTDSSKDSQGVVINAGSTDSSNGTVISLDQSDGVSQIVVSDGSSEVPRDSQDSNKTEIYELDDAGIYSSAIQDTRHTVTVVSPTRIRINSVPNIVERRETMEEVEDNVNNANEPFNNAPSTSRQGTITMNNDILPDFNLIEYVREITNAPDEVVRKHCKKINLRTDVKPMAFLLNMLIDNILSNVVDSEDSDVEHLPDFNPEEMYEEAVGGPVEQNAEAPINHTSTEGVAATNVETPMEVDADIDKQLVQHLCLVFSDACPKYIKTLCRGKVNNNEVLDNLVTEILNTNGQYPKRPQPPPEPECLPDNQLEILKEFLPDADPDYLSMMLDKFDGKPDLVKTFLNDAMEKKNYPTLKDYQRRQQLSAQQKQYTTEFNVENFVKLIPDPDTFFKDPSRKIKISNTDSHYILVFMRNKFNRIQIRHIQGVFSKSKCDIAKTINELEKLSQSQCVMKSVRKPIEMPNSIENIPLLQELAYYTHKTEIDLYLKQQSLNETTEREEAKNKGLLKTCNCCYDDEVLPKDIHRCENGCEFCKSCIVKSSEVLFGEGKLDFPCLMNCSSSFSLQTLQMVLSPKLFSKIAQKKALEEIKGAGIEELEVCPFCDFATIPAEGYNIFTCMNPECMKESCRMCKEPSHIPLRCDEIEKDEDVRARTFVENKMTEALLRKCWKCGVKFFKEEGCNKMTCSCGAQMCYVCGKAVDSYKHFNGNGGDRYDLCPLYSDTNVLNKENVLKGAEEAKAEIGNVNLKHDPTADVNKHYQERKKMYPQHHLLAQQILVPPAPVQPINNMPVFGNVARPPVDNIRQPPWVPIRPNRNEWMMPNGRYPPVFAAPPFAGPINPYRNQGQPVNVPRAAANRPQPFPYM